MFKLRDYQEECIDAALSATGNVLCVLPTGSGKSLVAAGLIQRILSYAPDFNIIVLQHRKELVEQNYDKFCKLCPDLMLRAGIYSASVGIKDAGKQITFAQIQSIHSKASILPTIHMCIVDEVHRIKREDTGMFRTFIAALRAVNPNMGLIGMTATPFRTESGIIMDGKDCIFPEVTFDIPMRPLIDKGLLCNLVSKFGKEQANLSKCRIRQGEYVLSDMENAISPLTKSACTEIVELGKDRRHWLLFCPGVKSAEEFARELESRGIRAAHISGEMCKKDREAILSRFESGEIQALTNCDILTEGYDFAGIDLIAILRGTKSAGLFVQMCGRGLRAQLLKLDCLILDFAGNLERFGAVDNIRVKKTKSGYGLTKRPLKTCPQCGAACGITLRNCDCGFVFERLAPNHEAEASARPVLSQIREVTVRDVAYKIHNKLGKPPSLKVVYEIEDGDIIREFICFEHEGYAKKKAYQWWRLNSVVYGNLPANTEEAFIRAQAELKPVRKITIQPDGKWWRILKREYGKRIECPVEEIPGLEENIFG